LPTRLASLPVRRHQSAEWESEREAIADIRLGTENREKRTKLWDGKIGAIRCENSGA
jgi:hypothetical protein